MSAFLEKVSRLRGDFTELLQAEIAAGRLADWVEKYISVDSRESSFFGDDASIALIVRYPQRGGKEKLICSLVNELRLTPAMLEQAVCQLQFLINHWEFEKERERTERQYYRELDRQVARQITIKEARDNIALVNSRLLAAASKRMLPLDKDYIRPQRQRELVAWVELLQVEIFNKQRVAVDNSRDVNLTPTKIHNREDGNLMARREREMAFEFNENNCCTNAEEIGIAPGFSVEVAEFRGKWGYGVHASLGLAGMGHAVNKRECHYASREAAAVAGERAILRWQNSPAPLSERPAGAFLK